MVREMTPTPPIDLGVFLWFLQLWMDHALPQYLRKLYKFFTNIFKCFQRFILEFVNPKQRRHSKLANWRNTTLKMSSPSQGPYLANLFPQSYTLFLRLIILSVLLYSNL